MKKQFKYLSILILALFLTSCEEDPILYTGGQAPVAYSFAKSSETVGFCQPTVPLTVEVTETSNQDRTINVTVDPESTAVPSEYDLETSVVIPAGEFVGDC